MIETSYIKLDWKTVEGLARDTIRHINKVREHENYLIVSYIVQNKNKRLAHRLLRAFGLATDWTYEMSEEYARKSRIPCNIPYPSIYGWGDLERAKRLLDMCEQKKDIYLSYNDYRAIRGAG